MNILDASAVLAVLYDEPGAEEVLERLDDAVISSVNFAEVLQKAATAGRDIDQVAGLLRRMLTGVIPFDDRLAVETAQLWDTTRSAGLSLADRACLALAAAVGGLAITTDRSWAGVELANASVHVIRR